MLTPLQDAVDHVPKSTPTQPDEEENDMMEMDDHEKIQYQMALNESKADKDLDFLAGMAGARGSNDTADIPSVAQVQALHSIHIKKLKRDSNDPQVQALLAHAAPPRKPEWMDAALEAHADKILDRFQTMLGGDIKQIKDVQDTKGVVHDVQEVQKRDGAKIDDDTKRTSSLELTVKVLQDQVAAMNSRALSVNTNANTSRLTDSTSRLTDSTSRLTDST